MMFSQTTLFRVCHHNNRGNFLSKITANEKIIVDSCTECIPICKSLGFVEEN